MATENTVGERIKALREAQGLSVFELSHAAGMQTQTLRYWESGERVPTMVDVLARLSAVLGVTLDYLVTGKTPTDMGVSA